MASSSTEISNLALANIGVNKQIANLVTERSAEAEACRTYYEISRRLTLRDFNWPFAAKFASLGLVEEDPNDEWGFSYRYPSDCLEFRRIQSGIRNDSLQSRVKYKLGIDDDGRLIYTDQSEAVGEYTLNVTDPLFFPDDFVMALSYRLGMFIAPHLIKGDAFKMGERCEARYYQSLSMAAANSANEQADEEVVQSEFIRIREGDLS